MTIEITVLRGPVTVAYRKEGKKWYATALEFDLVGIGTTRAKAFKALQEIVNEYLSDCAEEKGPVEFLFPAEPKEWNNDDKEWFRLTAVILTPDRNRKAIPKVINLSDLHSLRKHIKSFDLIPESAVA